MLAPPPREPCRYTPTSMYTLRWLEPVLLALNVVGVHVLLPLVAVFWLARRVRYGDQATPPLERLRLAALLIAATTYWYLAALVNFVETAENMRYRIEVEPLVWLVTLLSATELARLAAGPMEPAGLGRRTASARFVTSFVRGRAGNASP
jgi:hypothetical protein